MKSKRVQSSRYGGILLLCIVTVLMCCFLPLYLLYINNLAEMTFVSILKPAGISMAIGVGLYLVLCSLLHKSLTFSGLFSSCIMLFLLNSGSINRMLKKFVAPITALVLTMIAVGAISALLWKVITFVQRKGYLRKAITIVLVTVCGLIVVNTVPVAGQVKNKAIAAASATPPPEAASLPAKREIPLSKDPITEDVLLQNAMPNIYYFILDEYAAFDVIDKYYGYDNAAFADFLEDAGFNISLSSSCITPQSELAIADVVTLHYLTEENRTISFARKKLANALLYSELEGLGYSLYQMSTKATIFKGIANLRDESLFDTGEPETEDGATVSDIARDQSILSVLNGIGGAAQNTPSAAEPAKDIELLPTDKIMDLARHGYSGSIKNRLSVFDYFDDAGVYAEADRVAIFSYICCPHVPFLFQANGAPIEGGHRADWQNMQYYLGQYQYVTARMKRIIQAIIAENPNCIIIIQSDHGVRWHEDCAWPHTFEISPQDECRVLNAMYCCGRELDIEGLSPTNTVRLLLSQFGLHYPQLP